MTPTLQHIIFVDLLPIVIIVALFLVYRRMELRKWKFKLKNAENDADFWFNKASIYEKELLRFRDEFQGLSKEIRKGNARPESHPSNAQVLPPAGVARLIADLESKDFENILDRKDEPAQNLPDE